MSLVGEGHIGRQLPLIVDIKRGSREDGPGFRSVVFFKGCPLRCQFCQNPEAQSKHSELAFNRDRCVECQACMNECTTKSIAMESPLRVNRSRCVGCGACAAVCPTGALRMVGKYWPLPELLELLLRDEPFYRSSGGGVTLSGGECTWFPRYVGGLAQMLKSRSIHVALETSGWFHHAVFMRYIAPYVDLVMFDVKLLDEASSGRIVGRSSRRILNNLALLLRQKTLEVHPRVLIVPGVTDNLDNLERIVDCLISLGARQTSLLPYNPMGLAMWNQLGKSTPPMPAQFVPRQHFERIREVFQALLDKRSEQRMTPQLGDS